MTTRAAIVVGGASGIGWATAKALAAEGCRVIVADRNTDGADDRAAELYDADRLARDTLRAVKRNKALLVKPRLGHAQWIFARLAPGLMQRASVRFVARQRAMQAALPG